MAQIETEAGEKLEVRRTFNSPPEKLFRAWTDPKLVAQWFPPPGEYEAAETTVDLRPGGSYRWGLRKLPGGPEIWNFGTFLEVDAPRRLVYTWRWGQAADVPETLVTVEFHPRGSGTELVLRHERFTTTELKNQHLKGWTHCFEQLANFIEKEKAR